MQLGFFTMPFYSNENALNNVVSSRIMLAPYSNHQVTTHYTPIKSLGGIYKPAHPDFPAMQPLPVYHANAKMPTPPEHTSNRYSISL
jgi:hypothetical protein